MARKAEFTLEPQFHKDAGHSINIIGQAPDDKVYVSVSRPDGINIGYVADRDLERLAVNILKALKSKHLK